MGKIFISFGCVLAAIMLGVAIAVMLSDIATVNAAWCDARPNCFREWVAATSGWAAAAGALFTIVVLWKTLEHMRVSSQQQLRAYIAVAEATIKGGEILKPVIKLKIVNHGQTPGYEVSLAYSYFRGDPRCEFTDDSGTTRLLGILAPGGSCVMDLNLGQLTHEFAQAMRDGYQCIKLNLVIAYVDAFGQRREFFVRYRTSEFTRLSDGPIVTVEASTKES